MARIAYSTAADADIEGIFTDLAMKAGHRVTQKYDARFEALYARLAMYPRSGAPRPALGSDVRIGVVPPYIVVYRYMAHDDVVFVLRVLHGRRRIVEDMLGEEV